jgi:hypothetical protein
MLISSPSLAWFLGFGKGTADATAPMTPDTDRHKLFDLVLFDFPGFDFPPKSEPSSPELAGVGSAPGGCPGFVFVCGWPNCDCCVAGCIGCKPCVGAPWVPCICWYAGCACICGGGGAFEDDCEDCRL